MSAGSSGRILHIDDERSVRDSMALLLRMEGYETYGAGSGLEALDCVSRGFQPDVLIVDFNLDPQLNGAEAVERIGRVLKYAPPTIMLTGNIDGAKVPRIVEVVVWMTRKPLNPQRLLAALPGLVQLSRGTRAASLRCDMGTGAP